ncbi:MAG: glycosyltransferase [Lachnospiraceae bacterium]|nr:glycosyltransferase [Lachnospiraceae bacterium]
MPQVSIIIPVYNVENFLIQCMESVINQTLKNIEIICVDDGSTDSSGTILDKYANSDARIKVIHKKNTGYGNSMNVGLQNALGNYIAIVESDDYIELDMMEKLYKKAEIYHTDIVKSNCFFYQKIDDFESDQYADIMENIPIENVFHSLEHPEIFLKAQAIWSGLYSRNFLINNHICFNETPGASYQDVSFAFQALACAEKVVVTKEAYYHYRINNLDSSVKAPNKVFCICDELDKIDSFIESRRNNKDALKWIASRLGYRVLKEHYHNLASAFQYTLFIRMVQYFKLYKQNGYLKGKLWDQEAIDDVNEVILNPNKYFMSTAKSFKDERLMSDICLNQRIYVESILKYIINGNCIAIYGAGKLGKELLTYLLSKGYPKEKLIFLVTDKSENESVIQDIPVLEVCDIQNKQSDIIVVVAIKEQNQFGVAKSLKKLNILNVVVMDENIKKYIRQNTVTVKK